MPKCETHPLPWMHAPENEFLLLMHYLDFVYPLQFPFYRPLAQHGGRGWTLAILRRCRLSFNAALILAAFHLQLVSPPPNADPDFPPFPNQSPLRPTPWCRSRLHHSLALAGLREHIDLLVKRDQRELLRGKIDCLCALRSWFCSM
jgi:hypothetical protein